MTGAVMPGKPSRVLAVGDVHADRAWLSALVRYALEQRCQAILQLGDLGYWPRIADHADTLQRLSRLLDQARIDLYFVEGNHDDLDQLFDTPYPKVGPYRQVAARIYHLERGARWCWGGLRFLAAGGAYSADKSLGVAGRDWFPRETLSETELAAILARPGQLDILVSHDAPTPTSIQLGYPPIAAALPHQQALATIISTLWPALCLHGHLHTRHQTLLEDTNPKRPCLVIGLSDHTQPEHNLRVFALNQLRTLAARVRAGAYP